jgi:hypothetical protein
MFGYPNAFGLLALGTTRPIVRALADSARNKSLSVKPVYDLTTDIHLFNPIFRSICGLRNTGPLMRLATALRTDDLEPIGKFDHETI